MTQSDRFRTLARVVPVSVPRASRERTIDCRFILPLSGAAPFGISALPDAQATS